MSGRATLEPLVINGSHGEGGGSLLRTSLAFAALTQRPIRIHSVRGAMRKTGMNSEDLTFLAALATSCRADVVGDELDSREVEFVPRCAPRSLDQRFDIGSHQKGGAFGCTCVIAQSLMPVLARSGAYSKVSIVGETYGTNTLSFDALERVTLLAHRMQGVYGFASLSWAGFGPGSKGELQFEVEPSVPLPLQWKSRGELKSCTAIITHAEVSDDIVSRGEKRIRELSGSTGPRIEVERVAVRARAPGVSVTFLGEFEFGMGSGSALGQRGLRMEAVVDQAWQSFTDWFETDATVDANLADQLLPIAALADGQTIFTTPRVTRRLVTMSWAIKQFIPVHITIKGQEGQPGLVTIER